MLAGTLLYAVAPTEVKRSPKVRHIASQICFRGKKQIWQRCFSWKHHDKLYIDTLQRSSRDVILISCSRRSLPKHRVLKHLTSSYQSFRRPCNSLGSVINAVWQQCIGGELSQMSILNARTGHLNLTPLQSKVKECVLHTAPPCCHSDWAHWKSLSPPYGVKGPWRVSVENGI